MTKTAISVVMPSYNEEKAVRPMVEAIRRAAGDIETEILLVDGGTDKTPEIAQSLGARVLRKPPRGHGDALKTCLLEASNPVIITSDCDNTYPMEFIPELLGLVEQEGYDLVSCCRMHSGLGKEMPLTNKFGNWLFAFLVRVLYRIDTHDVTTGMFCMKKSAVAALDLKNNYSLPCEIIVRAKLAGLKYREINIPYRFRLGEVTLNKWRSGKAYLKCIFNYRFGLGISPAEM